MSGSGISQHSQRHVTVLLPMSLALTMSLTMSLTTIAAQIILQSVDSEVYSALSAVGLPSHAQHVFDIDNVQANQSAIVIDIVNVDDIGVGLSSTRGWSALSFYMMSPLERVYCYNINNNVNMKDSLLIRF